MQADDLLTRSPVESVSLPGGNIPLHPGYKMIAGLRSPAARALKRGSHVKWKLENYVETGQLKKTSDAQFAQKGNRASQKSFRPAASGVSLQKALLLLKAKYDTFPFQTSEGKVINLGQVRTLDLRMKERMLAEIFRNLMKIRKLSHKPIDSYLLMTLLGVNSQTIKDPYFVTRDVIQLLEHDNNVERALELCRVASKDAATVGMNSILEWCMEKNKLELANKVVATRKKWAIPENIHSAVIYFNGMANCYEWGKLPDDIAASIVSRFDACAHKDTSVFNSALKALMKNYTNKQFTAWDFFGRLEELKISPDIQTFLTFLLGLQKFHKKRRERVRSDPQITALHRAMDLFQIQAELVAAAQMVLNKVLQAAMPPLPPSKEESIKNPLLLQEYKAKTRAPPIDIDRHFVSIFLQCFIDNSAGTSWGPSSGSHYLYLQHALRYLNAWVPEINDMTQYMSDASLNVEVSPEVKRKTDTRVERSKLTPAILPQEVLGEADAELNPHVIFPPSPFSQNKGRAIFSSKQRPLVDLTREKWADLHRRFQNKVQLKKNPELHAINKFLLRNYLDILLQLGLHQGFYVSIWIALSRWAGVRNVNLSKIASSPMAIGAIKKEDYAHVDLDTIGNVAASNTRVDASIIDINLVEDFIYKINDSFSDDGTGYALEIVSVLSKPETSSLIKPRPATFNAIFSMLNLELYRFHDRNYTLGRKVNALRNLPDNTAKNSLTAAQLHQTLDNMQILMESIMVRFNQISVDTHFVDSYNKLVERLYSATWTDAAPNNKLAVDIHLKIIRSGILMYRPRSIILDFDKRSYAGPIAQSMKFIYEKYKCRDDLNEREKRTMLALRDLAQAQRAADARAFEVAQRKLYLLTVSHKSF